MTERRMSSSEFECHFPFLLFLLRLFFWGSRSRPLKEEELEEEEEDEDALAEPRDVRGANEPSALLWPPLSDLDAPGSANFAAAFALFAARNAA